MMVLACSGIDPTCWAGNVASGLTDSALQNFEDSLMTAVTNVLKVVSTFWMSLPSPATSGGSIQTIVNSLGWYAGFFAIIGVFIALIRMAITNEFRAGVPAIKMVFNVIVVTAVYATGAALLIQAGDAFAPWLLNLAAGKDANMNGLITAGAITTVGVGPALLALIIAFIGSLANVLLMLVRGVMITIIMAFLPVLAASSGTEMGNQAFKKAQAYLLAFILFKPIAAVIYALGILLLKDQAPNGTSLDAYGQAIYQIGVGVLTLLMACALLPTLIKFIVPVAAQGVSGMFSGAGLAAGAVAAGAAVVTLGATAGAAAPALAGGSMAAGGMTAATPPASGARPPQPPPPPGPTDDIPDGPTKPADGAKNDGPTGPTPQNPAPQEPVQPQNPAQQAPGASTGDRSSRMELTGRAMDGFGQAAMGAVQSSDEMTKE